MRILVPMVAVLAAAQAPAPKPVEDKDGSRYVWATYKEAGLDYPYVPTARMVSSGWFHRLGPQDPPKSGDVAWWPGFAGVWEPKDRTVFTAKGPVPLDELVQERGPAAWLRFAHPAL